MAERRPSLNEKGKVMRKWNILLLAPLLAAALLSGCAALPFLSFVETAGSAAGSAYGGYVVWNSGEASKYYASDSDTTYRAVMQACDQLKLEATITKSAPKEGYSLEIKGKVPMHIDVLPFEKSMTDVVIKISILGDKHYVELFYSIIDENIPRNAALGNEKAK
jgi:hypothetical protein